MYLLSYFIVLVGLMTFICMCILGIIFMFDVPSLQESPALIALSTLLMLYCPSAILFATCLSYMFDKMDSAQSILPNIATFFGLIPFIMVMIIDMLELGEFAIGLSSAVNKSVDSETLMKADISIYHDDAFPLTRRYVTAFSSRWDSGAHIARDLLPIEQPVRTVRRGVLRRPRLPHVLDQRRLPSPHHVRLPHHGDHSDSHRGATALPNVVLCADPAGYQEEWRQNQRVLQVLPGERRISTSLNAVVLHARIVSLSRWRDVNTYGIRCIGFLFTDERIHQRRGHRELGCRRARRHGREDRAAESFQSRQLVGCSRAARRSATGELSS